jgi:hypothetical protein
MLANGVWGVKGKTRAETARLVVSSGPGSVGSQPATDLPATQSLPAALRGIESRLPHPPTASYPPSVPDTHGLGQSPQWSRYVR